MAVTHNRDLFGPDFRFRDEDDVNIMLVDMLKYIREHDLPPAYIRFEENGRLEGLLQNYFEEYLGQFPAQVFDRMNENFIHCSFYELVSRYLSSKYTFVLEQNNPKGRTDFEMTGLHGTDAWCDHRIVEFKYFKSGEEKKIKSKRIPYKEDVEQVRDYSRWVRRQFPHFTVRLYVCYVCANKAIKVWDVSERRIE